MHEHTCIPAYCGQENWKTSPERLQELSVRDHQGEKTALKTQLERNTTYVGCVLVLVLVFFSSQVVTAWDICSKEYSEQQLALILPPVVLELP